MTDGEHPPVNVEWRTRKGVDYIHVEFPSFTEMGKVEVGINYWADGRVSLGSSSVGFLLRRMHLHKGGSSVELERTPLPEDSDKPA